MTAPAVTGAGWLFSLHVLAAFAVGAPLAALVISTVALRSGDSARGRALAGLVRVFAIVFRAGVAATLVFGLWLVFTRDAYSVLDGWVIAALVLWLAIGGFGDSAISRLRRLMAGADAAALGGPEGRTPSGEPMPISPDAEQAPALRRVLWLQAGAVAATLAEFAVMLWRPGA